MCNTRRQLAYLGPIAALTALISGPCVAQDAPDASPAPSQTPAGQTTRAPLRPYQSSEVSTVIVTGRRVLDPVTGVTGRSPGGGLMSDEDAARGETTLTRDFIAKLTPATTALQAIQFAPGANVASSDPFGFSEQTNIAVRGLNEDEIGYLLEGLPIADIETYTAYTAEWGDTEDYSEISLSQGSDDLSAPLTNSAGGEISVRFRDPPKTFGGMIDYSYGSHNTNRTFARIDTGDIAGTGLRGYVSGSYATFDTWRGPGYGRRRHAETKFVKDWDNGSHFGIAITGNEIIAPTYTNPTLSQFKQLGYSDNFDGKLNGAEDTGYWNLYSGGFRAVTISSPDHIVITSKLALDITPYFYYGAGGGGGGAIASAQGNYSGTEFLPQPLNVNPSLVQADGTLLAQGTYSEKEHHPGIVASLAWKPDSQNFVTVGYWFDYFDFRTQSGYVQPNVNGDPPTDFGTPLLSLPGGAPLYTQNFGLVTKINSIFGEDSLSLLDDKLQVNIGVKGVYVDRAGYNNLPGPQTRVAAHDSKVLPRISAKYQLDKSNQVFADVTTNFRLPAAYVYFNSYYDGQLGSIGSNNLKDEQSVEEEVGYRHLGLVDGSLTFFNYNFRNRNLSTIAIFDGAQYPATINGGDQTSRGVDAELSTHPWHGFSPYVSLEYLDARTTSDLPIGSDMLPTNGKTAVRSPEWQAAAALSYDNGSLFGHVIGKWVDSEYSDFMNEEKIPSHGQLDFAIGYRLKDFGVVKHPQIQLNLYNITNSKYLSGVNTVSTNAADTVGVRGTLIPGSSPTYIVAADFSAIVTVTLGF